MALTHPRRDPPSEREAGALRDRSSLMESEGVADTVNMGNGTLEERRAQRASRATTQRDEAGARTRRPSDLRVVATLVSDVVALVVSSFFAVWAVLELHHLPLVAPSQRPVRQRPGAWCDHVGLSHAVLARGALGVRDVPRAGSQRRGVQSQRGSRRADGAHCCELAPVDRLRARHGATSAGGGAHRLLVPDDHPRAGRPLDRQGHRLVARVVPGARADHRRRRGRAHPGRQDRRSPGVPHQARGVPGRRRASAQRRRGAGGPGHRQSRGPGRHRGARDGRPRHRRLLSRSSQRLPAHRQGLRRQRGQGQHRAAPVRSRQLSGARGRHRGHPVAGRGPRRAESLQHGGEAGVRPRGRRPPVRPHPAR